jgi:cardiolipin synthase
MKSKQGVKVRFIIDKVGSIKLNRKYINDLRKAGVEVTFYSYILAPFLRLINTQINYRNHRKIVVIDSKIAFLGGINIGDEYLGLGKMGEWLPKLKPRRRETS